MNSSRDRDWYIKGEYQYRGHSESCDCEFGYVPELDKNKPTCTCHVAYIDSLEDQIKILEEKVLSLSR